MGFQDMAFLPSRGRFSTTFLKNCGRGKSLGTTTCLKAVVGVSKGMLPVNCGKGKSLGTTTCLKAVVGVSKGMLPVNCGKGKSLGTTTCLKAVVGVSKGILPVKYFRSIKASFLCQSNFVDIIRLSQR